MLALWEELKIDISTLRCTFRYKPAFLSMAALGLTTLALLALHSPQSSLSEVLSQSFEQCSPEDKEQVPPGLCLQS